MIATAPPVHSVTFWPVISTWMPPAMRAFGAVHREEAAHLGQDAVERPRLVAVSALTTLPCIGSQLHTTGWPSRFTARTSLGSPASILSWPKRLISVIRPGSRAGIERVEQAQQHVGLEARAALHADRVADAAQELDMRRPSKRVRSPIHSMCALVSYQSPVRRILPRQRLLVGQQQRLVAGVEAGALELRHGLGIDPAGFHEVERLADPVGDVLDTSRPRGCGP